jgi:gamma-glutamyltranspeptidase/glutathione hydrolase
VIRLLRTVAAFALAVPAFAGSQAIGTRAAIATSSRIATQAGLEVLRNGGNAADAAVAVAFVLGVVEPETAGIGGGGMLAFFDARTEAVWTLDFRENAPSDLAGPAPRAGVAAAAVPSFVAGMGELSSRFGSRPWKDLLAPSLRAAKGDLATTLQQIATTGARAFYDGPIPSHIVEQVKKLGGSLSLHDFRGYKAVWRSPIEIHFGDYTILTVAPPSAGGMMIAEMLNITAPWDLRTWDATTIHLFAEAERRAAYDRDRFFADQAAPSYRDIVSAEHAVQWRAQIEPRRATPTSTLGPAAPAIATSAHTTHFTIADAQGNVAAVTIALDDDSGSGLMLPGTGFALNNAAKSATRGGDRVPTSMTPAIVLRERKPWLALGSSGGAMTPAIVLQVIFGVARQQKTLNEAIESPRFDQQSTPEDITFETSRAPRDFVTQMTAMAHGVRGVESIGNVNAIIIEQGRLTAVADSRGRGVAGGM